MRVMLIAGNFPPDPAIGAVRTGAIRDYLVRCGHSVHVISLAGQWAGLAEDPGSVTRTPWIRLPVFCLVRGGQTQRLFEPNDPFQGRSSGPARKKVSAFAHAALSVPDTQGGWIPFAYRAGLRELRARPADVILASGPTFSAHIAAALLARKFNVPWVADYRDLWSNSAYYPFGKVRRTLDRALERWTIKTSDRVSTVSFTLAEDLARDLGVAPQLVRNGYDPCPMPPVSKREPLSRARANLLYVGNNFYGGRRSPRPLFHAARELGLKKADVRFHFLGADPRTVLPLAEEEGTSELVNCLAPVDRAESLLMQARADALMLLLWNDPKERGTLTGKLFEYVGVRRPIVLVGYGQGEAAQIIKDYALGWIADTPDSARAALQQLVASKPSPALLEDLSGSDLSELSRESQCAVLEELLLEAVRARPGSEHE